MKFYDTNALLELGDTIYNDFFYISDITLIELEHIKTSYNKDETVKYKARRRTRLLNQNMGAFDVTYYRLPEDNKWNVPVNNDSHICFSAYCIREEHPDLIFVTRDMACRHLATFIFLLHTQSIETDKDDYDGYIDGFFSDEGLRDFYNHPEEKLWDMYDGQYIIVHNEDGDVVDKYRWSDSESKYLPVKKYDMKTQMFGDIKPMNGDVYQQLLIDSFHNNQITLVSGPAGTGKTYLSLGFLFKELENHKIDKIVVFCNPVKTKHSASLGFYPGTKDEKIMDSQIGNMLGSKFGSKVAVHHMIMQDKLVLLPMSDIRGYDTSGQRCGVYIVEAQNLDIELMKLALQRIGEDSICIIDGDYSTQVDSPVFAGNSNGMRRASEVFRGSGIFGQVVLKNIYRSKIADIAQKM